MEQESIILTSEGKKKLEDELRRLTTEVRPEVIEELKFARAQGDLSENADYDAARTRQAEVEAEIKKIEDMLNNCRVIDGEGEGGSVVRLGATVTIFDLALKQEFTYQIRGSVEADPFKGVISNSSPLAQAILGHAIGEEVTVQVKKPYAVRIVKIS